MTTIIWIKLLAISLVLLFVSSRMVNVKRLDKNIWELLVGVMLILSFVCSIIFIIGFIWSL